MNPPPSDPEFASAPGFESLLRQRASRLAKPDPAWRAEVLEAARSQPTVQPRRVRRSIWKTRWFPASLAACWLLIPFLNWSARRETQRFSHYANAQAVPVLMGGWHQSILVAAASSR